MPTYYDTFSHPETRVLIEQNYRWWTCLAWVDSSIGVKFGPITVVAYLWGWRPNVAFSLCGRWILDTLWIG